MSGSQGKKSDDIFESKEAIEIRKIIEKHWGVFKFSSNIKLYCNFCKLELPNHSNDIVQKHLYDVGHLENFLKNPQSSSTKNKIKNRKNNNNNNRSSSPTTENQFISNRCITVVTNELVLVSDDEDETGDPETNKIDIVIDAYQSGIIVNRKFDKIHCIPCDQELRDSLLLLKKHLLKDGLHRKNLEKHLNSLKQQPSTSDNLDETIIINGSKKIQQFVDSNSNCLEWDGPTMVHCKLCHKVIQAKLYSLIRHCQRNSHKSRLTSINDNNNDDNYKKIQIEKDRLKKIIEKNSDCFVIHLNQIYCRLCQKIIGTKYNNVLHHLNRSIHLKRKTEFNNNNNDDEKLKNLTTSSSTSEENVEKLFENLWQKEKNRLNRLISKHSEYLVFYNQCENVLCKPCKRIMLAKYINVQNHLRRQSHKDKTIDYNNQNQNNKKEESPVQQYVENESVILLEQIPLSNQVIIQ